MCSFAVIFLKTLVQMTNSLWAFSLRLDTSCKPDWVQEFPRQCHKLLWDIKISEEFLLTFYEHLVHGGPGSRRALTEFSRNWDFWPLPVEIFLVLLFPPFWELWSGFETPVVPLIHHIPCLVHRSSVSLGRWTKVRMKAARLSLACANFSCDFFLSVTFPESLKAPGVHNAYALKPFLIMLDAIGAAWLLWMLDVVKETNSWRFLNMSQIWPH